MDEPTAMLPPVSTVSLTELLERGPLPLAEGLELLGVIAAQIAKMHAEGKTHGLLTAQVIRVQTFESGPPVVVFSDPEATRDMSEGGDQYALGVLAFQVLAGRYPKPNESLRDAMPEAPPALDRLVAKLMVPRPSDRLGAAAAQRQLEDLAGAALDPKAKAASPLSAPPALKRPGTPIGGDDHTDLRAYAPIPPRSGSARPQAEEIAPKGAQLKEAGSKSKPAAPRPNPFAEDEATAMVEARPTAPDPPPRAGPAMDDEKTQFDPVAKTATRAKPTERMEAMRMPPPVMTPPHEAPVVREPSVNTDPIEPVEPSAAFEPSDSDLPAAPGLPAPAPRSQVPRRRRRNAADRTPMSEFFRAAKSAPPWVWGAVGVGLAFFVLLLIALVR